MNEKTKADYRKLAEYHLTIIGEVPYVRIVKKYLEKLASEYTPAYWRKLRNALAFYQAEMGFDDNAKKINKIKNPMTLNKSNSNYPKNKKRVKHISAADRNKIRDALIQKDDEILSSMINIFDKIGIRPAELLDIQLSDKLHSIKIIGAKKTEKGNRGLDRIICCDPSLYKKIKQWITTIKVAATDDKSFFDKYRSRFNYLMRKLFPCRKKRPCFYSFRHMMGTKLKSSSFNDYQVAYLMGHQSTKSVARYGDRRHKNSKSQVKLSIKPAVSIDKIKTLVRDKKTDYINLSKQKANQKNPAKNYHNSLANK